MRKILLFLAALASSLLANSVRADETNDPPFYVGLDLGHVSVSRGRISTAGANSGYIDGGGTSWSVSGGYYFTDNLGVELGYHDYGKPTAHQQSGVTLHDCPTYFSCPQLSAGTAELLGKLELVPQLDGVLRLGLQEWDVGSPGDTLLGKTSGSAFVYGIGVSRHFDYNLNLEITYEHSSFTTEETRIGFSYSF